MTQILDGRVIKEARKKLLAEQIQTIGFVPTLAVVQVGDRDDSNAYIENKKRFAEEIGAKVLHFQFTEHVKEADVVAKIKEFNENHKIHGIIVQLPMPVHIDRDFVINAIDPRKDVDGLTATNLKYLYEGRESGFVPATTTGILSLLKYYNIEIEGKKVTLVGRSSLVGKPTLLALINENATVTLCHSETSNLKEHTQNADILIVAIGKPKLINHEYVKEKQVVIDVGINMIDRKLDEEVGNEKELVGDVDYSDVFDIVSAITPVPGGVGQMTVLCLFENLVKACVI